MDSHPKLQIMPTASLAHIPRERAAELLNISVRTLDRHIRRGFLRAERFDRSVFVLRPSFERYYEKQAKRGLLPPLSKMKAGQGARQSLAFMTQTSGGETSTLSNTETEAAPSPRERDHDHDLQPVRIYKTLYEELKTKYDEQQRRMEGAHYRVGQLEAQLKNMVPLLEVKQERKRFELVDRQYRTTLQEAKVRIIRTKRLAEGERYNKAIYMALVYILLALQPVFWVMMQR